MLLSSIEVAADALKGKNNPYIWTDCQNNSICCLGLPSSHQMEHLSPRMLTARKLPSLGMHVAHPASAEGSLKAALILLTDSCIQLLWMLVVLKLLRRSLRGRQVCAQLKTQFISGQGGKSSAKSAPTLAKTRKEKRTPSTQARCFRS